MSSTSSDGVEYVAQKRQRPIKTLPSGSSTSASKDGDDGDTDDDDQDESSSDDDVEEVPADYAEPKVSFAVCFFWE